LSDLALDDLRVIDLSQGIAGPYCTKLLADCGAEVIKVEPPQGDYARTLGPFPDDVPHHDKGGLFIHLNGNKKSVTLDIETESGRTVLRKLLAKADALVESYAPGHLASLGLGYDDLKEEFPDLVYCSITPFGQTGPYASLVGHDINYISIGGALGMTGWPGQPPAIPLNVIADFAGGGLYAAFAILTAVIARERTGRGQYVDMAMSDGVTSLLAMAASQYFSAGRVLRPGEDMLNGAVPSYNVYQASDGKWLSIGCLEPWFWQELCEALGCEEFVPHQNNREKFPEMFDFLRSKFGEKTRDEWFQELRQRDICVAPVYGLDEVFADPHVQARGMIAEVEHPEFGTVRQVGVGPKLSDTPGSVRSTAPKRGEHTEEILRQAGYTEEEIGSLKEAKAAG